MTSLARSPDGKYAVLAGEKIFKTIRIESTTITEKNDLRAAITSHSSTHSDALVTNLDIKDVQWSHSELSSTIVTASANGRITLYDLNRLGAGLEVSRIQGHFRQIHKISVNPHKANWLLSGSQDGTIKLFDLRVHSSAQGAPHVYKCNADAIRDVKWSPMDGMEFACATDSGVVQKWDMRQTVGPLLKLNAHSKACQSISWHPDGKNLISGGLDQLCHVWDVSKTAEKRQKPKHTIQTPAPISIVSWRPPKWTSTFEKWRAAQIAVVYDDTNPAEMQESTVQIWDIARPGLPFKEVFDFETSPTGLMWQGSDLIWTVGKYGAFTQTDIAFAAKTIDNRSLSCLSISPTGEILMALEKRIPTTRQRLAPSTSTPDATGLSDASNTDSQTSNLSGNYTSVYRADAEDDLLGNFLNIRPRRHRRRAESDHPAASSSRQAPPTLAESLEITGDFVNKQLIAYGHVPGTAEKEVWDFLSKVYLGCIYEEKKDALNPDMPPMNLRFEHIMEQFATAAEMLKWYRHAQSWRVISHSLGTTLARRAVYHRDQRVARHKEQQEQRELEKKRLAKQEKESRSGGVETPRKNHGQELHASIKSIISEEIESTSNVATPLARPMQGHGTSIDSDVLILSPLPSVSSLPAIPDTSNEPNTEGYDFYDTASLVPAINIVTPQRKLPLRLDYPPGVKSSATQSFRRHDSSESFEMFSTSEDSEPAKFDSSSDNDDKDPTPRRTQAASQEVESSWESSLSFSQEEKADNARDPPMLVVQEPSLPNVGNATSDSDQPKTTVNESDVPAMTDPSQIIDSDYFPQPDDPLFIVEPLSPESVVSLWLEYEVTKSALTPAAIVLFLKPLLQPGTIDENQARQILLHFHQRLNEMSLFTSAALLRKLCVPDYPSVYEQGRWGNKMGFKCGKCGSTLEPDPENPCAMTHCRKCKENMDCCSLCQQKNLPDTIDGGLNTSTFDPTAPAANLWVWCQGCQHGGHSACLQAWHAQDGALFSGGQCPVEGCGHACIPGDYQNKLNQEAETRMKAELERQVRENSRSLSNTRTVRRDSEEVGASNAVESVRGALGNV